MLIAVSANNSNVDGPMEPRFGRAAGFMIFNSETEEFRFVDNSGNSQLGQGAGIQTAQMLADQGVKAVVSGTFGPKAEAALQQGGIEMITSSGSVREVVNSYFNSGQPVSNPETGGMRQQPASGPSMGDGCRRMGGSGRGMGMAGGGRGMGGGGRGMGGRGMGGGGMGRRSES